MKLTYGNRACEFAVAENLVLPEGYPEDTVRYALQRFFSRDERLRYDCTRRSVACRFASGSRKEQTVRYEIPAGEMELPRGRCLVKVRIDEKGAEVLSFRICRERLGGSGESRITVRTPGKRKKNRDPRKGSRQDD